MSLFDIFPKKQAETPASIVTVDDAAGLPVAKMKVKLELVQDLHGYDSPWPAGGGKNIGYISADNTGSNQKATPTYTDTGVTVTATGTYGRYGWLIPVVSGQTYTVSFKGKASVVGTGYQQRVYFGTQDNVWGSAATGYLGAVVFSDTTETSKTFTFAATTNTLFIGFYVSGSATDGSLAITDFQVELGSSATTYAPYSNICPITGRTGLTVYRTGKNLVDPSKKAIATGSTTTAKWYNDGTGFLLHGGQAYTLSANVSTDATYFVYIYAIGGTQLSYGKWTTIYTPSADTYVYFQYYESGGANLSDAELQLELGSTATTYEPYNGNTYAVDWSTQAGTVYHGTVDPVTGQLTVTYASVDLGSLTWGKYGTSFFYATLTPIAIGTNNILCSQYKTVETSNDTTFRDLADDCVVNTYIGGHGVRVKDSTKSSLSTTDFKTAMSGVQLVYELSTPLTYQLTPQQIVLIKNAINNVWTDAGDILEFEYYTEADYGPISGAFIDGQSLQDAGWFLKWRKLSAPKPKVDYTSIYGKDGSIDQTESLGDVFYEDRDVNLDMVYNGENWNEAYSDLLNAVHGQSCMVQFTDDPYWYWAARLVANVFTHKPMSLEMSGLAFPYKLSILEKSYQATVNGATEGTATELQLEGSRMRVSPKLVVTGEITIKWGTNTKTLSAGTYYVRGLKVGRDGVTIKVYGTGSVTITYREGSL